MPDTLSARLDRALDALARDYPGPGGAAAVVNDGEVLERHAFGYANAERRIPFTPRTLFRMCSITKQFTCALAAEAFGDLSALDADVAARLPALEGAKPGAAHLAHNQSGLRDYWAVAMLLGSPAEAPFGEAEAGGVIGAARSLQFAPGTRFSYVNQNFRLLGDVVADRLGESFADLLRRRIFAPAGMETAFLAADTQAMPDGTVGYEAMAQGGFRAAENRILWTGDAGLGASLDDMIAWERHIDATRDDPASLYGRISGPVSFADGAAATYGFGLTRSRPFGRAATGHGGALRGWRSHRIRLAAERLSVVVMFNHLSDAHAAAQTLIAAVLGEPPPRPDPTLEPPSWLGAWLEPETGLSVRIEAAQPGAVRLRYGHSPEILHLRADGSAGGGESPRLRPEGGGLVMERPGENMTSRLVRLAPPARRDIEGLYRCGEIGAELTVAAAGGVLYGGFSGPLGQGRMERLEPVAEDVWVLPCPRALDHTPPGDWTLAFRREGGRASAARVGCWLARGLDYERVG